MRGRGSALFDEFAGAGALIIGAEGPVGRDVHAPQHGDGLLGCRLVGLLQKASAHDPQGRMGSLDEAFVCKQRLNLGLGVVCDGNFDSAIFNHMRSP